MANGFGLELIHAECSGESGDVRGGLEEGRDGGWEAECVGQRGSEACPHTGSIHVPWQLINKMNLWVPPQVS